MRTISLFICVMSLSGAIYAPAADAGMICVPYPKTTFADVLNEKEAAVFAREKKGSSRRFDFFAERLTNSNPRIRSQAYLEVGRAPYSSIKRIAGSVLRQQIWELLANWVSSNGIAYIS